jgi:hypothetical protein
MTTSGVDPLSAPCIWCGYNGENYWQLGAHPNSCPWSDVGGEQTRRALLPAKISSLRAELQQARLSQQEYTKRNRASVRSRIWLSELLQAVLED